MRAGLIAFWRLVMVFTLEPSMATHTKHDKAHLA